MNSTIGGKLKTLRKSQKKSQQTVADAVGITRSTLSNYEIGRRVPDLRTLQKLAAYFGCNLDFFGIASVDEVSELLARAKEIFESNDISEERKRKIHDELMKLYLKL